MVGLTVAGPRSRDVLQKLTNTSLANADFPFMAFRRVDLGMAPVWLSRMTYTGDLGYEIWMQPEYQRYLFDLLWEAGREFDMRLFGFRALITMRLEKNFGTWYREYRPIYTPLEAGMDRVLKFDHDFIGRDGGRGRDRRRRPEAQAGDVRRRARSRLPGRRDRRRARVAQADGSTVVGWITSGGYAHYSGVSLAWGYIPAELADAGTTASRSRSSASAAPPRCSPSRCSTPPARACAAEGIAIAGSSGRTAPPR